MKIKILETFPGYDLYNEGHRKPVKTYRKDETHDVHPSFGQICVDGGIAVEVKASKENVKNKVDKTPIENKGRKGKK